METPQKPTNFIPRTLTLVTLKQENDILYILLEGDWSRLDGARYTEKGAYEESCLDVTLDPVVVEAAHILGAFDEIYNSAQNANCSLFGIRNQPLQEGTNSQDICKTILTKGGKVSLYRDRTAARVGKKASNPEFSTAVASVDLSKLMGEINKPDVVLKTATVKGE